METIRWDNIFLQEISCSATIATQVLRLDSIHSQISGNKIFKLKENIAKATAAGYDTLLTFGGAYSNHIAATAAAGQLYHIKTIGIIRGEEPKQLNSTLHLAVENGMQLKFVSREQYRQKNDDAFIDKLKSAYGNFYLIPEGGANAEGVKGCMEILQLPALQNNLEQFTHICCAAGTGTTAAGIFSTLLPHQQLLVFPAIKNGDYLQSDIVSWAEKPNTLQLITDYHFGGYAMYNEQLLHFVKQMKAEFNLPLDFIYTGKMMYGIVDLISKNHFPLDSKLLIIHTGGLQGNKGIELNVE